MSVYNPAADNSSNFYANYHTSLILVIPVKSTKKISPEFTDGADKLSGLIVSNLGDSEKMLAEISTFLRQVRTAIDTQGDLPK